MYTVRQQKSLKSFQSFVGGNTFTTQDLSNFDYKSENVVHPGFLCNSDYRVKRGEYRFPDTIISDQSSSCESHQISPAVLAEKAAEIPATAVNLMMVTDVEKMVPERFKGFVPWGHFRDIKNIIKSKIFYPIFVTGLSGNGKTLNVSQACAELNREMVRVNITIETDEDDLIGGFRLVDGETKFNLGPVAQAME